MNCYGYIISRKRAGNYTDSGAVAAGKSRERPIEDMVVGSGTGVCEGDILQLLFVKREENKDPLPMYAL